MEANLRSTTVVTGNVEERGKTRGQATAVRREIAFVLLNMVVIGALLVVHLFFYFQLGPPSTMLLLTLSVRFALLMFELVWLQRLNRREVDVVMSTQTHLSIIGNVVFAFLASVFGGTSDSHYSVLMLIPIIQASFHFGFLKTVAVIAVAIGLTFAEVWIYFSRRPPVEFGEFFEAATVGLIFLVVGIVVWLLVGSLRDEEAKLTGSLKELKELQTKLVSEEKLAAVGELSSAIAHEIRNPVTLIVSSLELAAKNPENENLRSEMFTIVVQESRRLEALTTDFLSFARRSQPVFVTTGVRETIEYCGSLARARLGATSGSIEIACDGEFTASFDRQQIQQALLNLVLNAADAIGPGGRITIGAEKSDRKVIFFVENDGPAIDASLEEKIFEPFFTAKANGTGLGLAIVRRIARAHGGEATLAENRDGTVRFELAIEA